MLFVLSAAGLGAPSYVSAQRSDIDSLTAVLHSPGLHARATAVASLNRKSVADLPEAARSALITLLEREATGQETYPDTTVEDDETYSEYVIDLTRGVLRLRDARSLRGLALLGLQTSRAAQEYVASLGDAAIPVLDEAWRLKERARPSIIMTWGYQLMPNGPLTVIGRRTILSRLLLAVEQHPIAGLRAARTASLVTLVPVLDRSQEALASEVARVRFREGLAALRQARDEASWEGILSQTAEWLSALCGATDGARRDACESLGNLIHNAQEQVRAGRQDPARNVLEAFAERAELASREGVFSPSETALLAGSARYVSSRL